MTATLEQNNRIDTGFAWPSFPLGLGTSRLCSLNGGRSIRQAARLIEEAFELGVRFVDTAPTYGQGQVEVAIGRLAADVRERMMICSKVGYTFGWKSRVINMIKPVVRPILPIVSGAREMVASARERSAATGKLNLQITPAVIQNIVEGSLKRINRDYLDLLLLHDPGLESVGSSANHDALNELASRGRIRAWGVSTGDLKVARLAVRTEGCSTIQIPFTREWIGASRDLLKGAIDRGTSLIANSVLASVANSLNGKAGMDAAEVEHGLAFALQQPAVRIVLCGTRSSHHLRQNIVIARRVLGESS